MTSARGKAVTFNSLDRWQIAGLTGTLANAVHGILTNNPPSGGVASVQLSGVAAVKLGGIVTAGRYLDIDASGTLVQVHPGGRVGIALDSGIAEDIIPCILILSSTADASVSNPNECIYITGDANTDGSIRICSTDTDPTAHIELRTSGVWNDTGFRFSASSIDLGREVTVGAACSFIKTFAPFFPDENQSALIPAVSYKDTTGSESVNAPIVGALVTTPIFTNAVSEVIANTIGFTFTSNYSRLIDKIIHEIGTVGPAGASCQYSVYIGTDNTGHLINQLNVPSGNLVANTTLTVDFDYVLSFRDTITFYLEISCNEPFSLKTDASGKPLTTFTEGRFGTVGIVTENMILDNNLDQILDNNLNPIYGNFF